MDVVKQEYIGLANEVSSESELPVELLQVTETGFPTQMEAR